MFHFGVSASEVATCHRPPSALSARRKKARHAPVRHCPVPLASRHNRDSPSTADSESERSMPVGHYGIAVMSRRDQDAAVAGRSSRGAARAGEAQSTRARATAAMAGAQAQVGAVASALAGSSSTGRPLCACAFAWGMCGSWARSLPVSRSTRSIPLSGICAATAVGRMARFALGLYLRRLGALCTSLRRRHGVVRTSGP
jgi:hypothetical protein